MKDKSYDLPQTVYQQSSNATSSNCNAGMLRIRGRHADNNNNNDDNNIISGGGGGGGQQQQPASPDANNGKGPKASKTTTTKIRNRFVMLLVGIPVVTLIVCKPFFPNFFEETNYFLHHIAKTIDYVIMRKQRKLPKTTKIIYYLHLSKCGGTSIMDAAVASGLSVPIRNGLTQRDWRCCGNEDTLQAQTDYANDSIFDLVANENDMYDAMDTDHYDYVVTLRDSRARYKSMYLQWSRDPIMAINPSTNFRTFRDFATWFAEDNYMFRKICGSKCRGIPKYRIPKHLFPYTLQRMEKFDSILFLEDFQSSYTKFATKHGWTSPEQKKRVWNTSGQNHQNNNNNNKDDKQNNNQNKDDDGWDFKMSALDDALYEYSKRVDVEQRPYETFTKRTQENVDIYFAAVDAAAAAAGGGGGGGEDNNNNNNEEQ